MIDKTGLGEIPGPSTAINSSVRLEQVGTVLTVTFTWFDLDTERTVPCSVVFTGVRAHAHRSESATDAWRIEGAYDTVCEVHDSPWLDEVVAMTRKNSRHDVDALKHFLLFLDGAGSYEAIAVSWELRTGT